MYSIYKYACIIYVSIRMYMYILLMCVVLQCLGVGCVTRHPHTVSASSCRYCTHVCVPVSLAGGDSDSSSVSEDWEARDKRTSVRTHSASSSRSHVPAHLTSSQITAHLKTLVLHSQSCPRPSRETM